MMKWRTLFILLVLGLMLGGCGLGSTLGQSTSAVATDPSQLSASQDIDEETIALLTADEIESLVSELFQQWAEGLKQPGWFYLVTSQDRTGEDYGVLGDGTPIPTDFEMHSWYLLDDSGIIVSKISLMLDLQGVVVQYSYFDGQIVANFPNADLWEKEPYDLRLITGVRNMLGRWDELGLELDAELVTVDGIDAIQVMTVQIGPPNIHHIGVFALETGKPISSCIKRVSSNGQELESDCVRIVHMNWEDPPTEQIEMLESISAEGR